tara:strand:- start:1483 stop:2007 length:525 start_codon:yes stop_codon:yes gene_type:complete
LAEEFVIKSQKIEDKVNQLLPSQGGFQAGVDFSASTMVVPIIDLTETAEGGTTRADLQSSLSLNSVTSFNVENATTTLINTTGYFRVFGTAAVSQAASNNQVQLQLTDGTTTKVIYEVDVFGATTSNNFHTQSFDFIVFLRAGDSLVGFSDGTQGLLAGCTRQIADLQGNLVNP